LIHPSTPEFAKAVRDDARATVDALKRQGRKIVIIEPIPIGAGARNPLQCLSQARFLDDCRYVAAPGPTPLERYYRSLANGSNVFSLDLDRLVCPYSPICDPIVNGVVVKRDWQHLTAAYSKTLAVPIGAVLIADGVLPKRR
jgi:SGNH domain-containing protein